MRPPWSEPGGFGTGLALTIILTTPVDAAPTNWDVRIHTGSNSASSCIGLNTIPKRLPHLGQIRTIQWACTTHDSHRGTSSLTFDGPREDHDEINKALQTTCPDIMFRPYGLCVPMSCNKDFDLEKIGTQDTMCADAAAVKARTSASARSINTTTKTSDSVRSNWSDRALTNVYKREDDSPTRPSGGNSIAPLPDKHIQPNSAVCFGDTPSSDYMVVVGRPYSEKECSRLREIMEEKTESTVFEFSCMDNKEGWTTHFEGEAITQLGFGFTFEAYETINERLQTAYSDIEFSGAGLCTEQDCYVATSDDYIRVRNMTCGLKTKSDPPVSTTASSALNTPSTATQGRPANETLAPLPDRHVQPNTALCLGAPARYGYNIVIGKAYDQNICRKIKDVINSMEFDSMMDTWEFECFGNDLMWPKYFTGQPVFGISVKGMDEWSHVTLNKRLKKALPDVNFEGLGACDHQSCYLETSDDSILVRNITCGGGTELLAPSNTTMPPAQQSTSDLAPLPHKHLKANTSICWNEGTDAGQYRITIATPFSVETCQKAQDSIKNRLPKEAAEQSTPSCVEPGSDDYFKDQKANITVLTTAIEDRYVGALNEGLHAAYPDVMFGDLGLCAAYDCYQTTTDARIKIKNTTCAQKAVEKRTHMNLLPIAI